MREQQKLDSKRIIDEICAVASNQPMTMSDFHLSIGRIGCSIRIKEEYGRPLFHRYSKFSRDSKSCIEICMYAVDDISHVNVGFLPKSITVFDIDERLYFRRRWFAGYIDPACREAKIILIRAYDVAAFMAVEFCYQYLAPIHDCFFLHAVGALLNGTSLIIAGPPHSGKSSLAALLARRGQILSDDQLLVYHCGTRWMNSGTPFCGEFGHGEPISSFIDRMYILHKCDRFSVKRLPKAQATAEIINNVFWPAHRSNSYFQKIIDNCCRLVEDVPIYLIKGCAGTTLINSLCASADGDDGGQDVTHTNDSTFR